MQTFTRSHFGSGILIRKEDILIRKIWELATEKFVKESATQFEKGMKTYGVPLTNFNGRNPFSDAREEVIDLHQYLTQAEAEFETVAHLLYIYSITEGFFKHLPPHIQQKLLQVSEGKFLADLCQEEGIAFYGTIKAIGPKNIQASPQPGIDRLQEQRYSNLSGADYPHND